MVRQSHDYEKESERFYDKIASNFDHTFDGFLASFFKKFIIKNLKIKPESMVLDIGCANGKLLSMINQIQPIQGFGVDISSEMVKVARQLHPNFTFETGTAEKIPFKSGTYDFVICSASFHHFPNPQDFLKEASRLLSNGGKLVIAEIHIPIVTKLYNWRLNRFSTEGDVKVYTPKELTNLFEKQDFKVTKKKIFLQIQYYELQKTTDSFVSKKSN